MNRPVITFDAYRSNADIAFRKRVFRSIDSDYNSTVWNRRTEGKWNGDFLFAILADVQLGMLSTDSFDWEREKECFRRVIERVNALKPLPRFVCVCGDLVNEYPGRDTRKHHQQNKDFSEMCEHFHPDIALFCLCGNHDIGNRPNSVTINAFKRRFGSDHYVFWIGGVKCFALNSQLYNDCTDCPGIRQQHHRWLLKELTKSKKENPEHIFFFSHIPPFIYHRDEEKGYFNFDRATRDVMVNLATKFGVSHWFTGHFHRNSVAFSPEGNLQVVVNSAVGCVIQQSVPTTCPTGIKGFTLKLGDGLSGFRVVKVSKQHVHHQFFPLEPNPKPIDCDCIGLHLKLPPMHYPSGHSVWLEVPDLQCVIYRLNMDIGIQPHPSHIPLTPVVRSLREVRALYIKIIAKLAEITSRMDEDDQYFIPDSTSFRPFGTYDVVLKDNPLLTALDCSNRLALSFSHRFRPDQLAKCFPDFYKASWRPYCISIYKTIRKPPYWIRLESRKIF